MRKISGRTLFIVFSFICSLIAIALFLNLGSLLADAGEDKKSEFVFCSTGSTGRIKFAIERVVKKKAKTILLTGNYHQLLPLSKRKEIKFIAERVREKIGRRKLILLQHSSSTFEDALRLQEFLKSKKKTDVLVTSDIYNLRRVKFIFKKVFRKTSHNLYFCATPNYITGLNPEKWYTAEKDFLYVFNEILKSIYYFFKYFFV
ncbi:ElyC/SanA/YdcF family protein [Candidatus Riflebacteria bacterium]